MDTQNKNKTIIDALKGIINANSRKEILENLTTLDRKPGSLLSRESRSESMNKGIRFALMIAAILAIMGVTYAAFIGGDFIFEYAGPIALLFGAMDVSIVILLYLQYIKGRNRVIAIAFETFSLLYLGFAMTGFFGGGNLTTAAGTKLEDSYAIAKSHYTAAQSTAESFQKAIDNAAGVRDIEAKRDGKGVVFEKASFIASFKPSTFSVVDSIPAAPHFTSLTEANKWLQKERQIVSGTMSKYDAGLVAMTNQAEGTVASLAEAMKMGLSQEQISNLQVLSSSMSQIAAIKVPASKIPDEVLKSDDLNGSGIENYFGYIADCVIVAFIFMLAYMNSSEKKLDDIKAEEIRLIAEDMLDDEGIRYESDTLNAMSAKKLHETLKWILESDGLKEYIKNKISFEEYLEFSTEYPNIARHLGSTTWPLSEIRKEIRKNPSFVDNAVDALKINFNDWTTLLAVTTDPTAVFHMNEQARTKFVDAMKKVQRKAKFKPEQLKEFIDQFLAEDNFSEEFLGTLEACVANLSEGKLLQKLNPSFMNNASPEVATFICKNVDNEKHFTNITKGWNEALDTTMQEVLNNGVVNETGFERFMQLVVNWGGLNGLRIVLNSYADMKKEISTSEMGNKNVVLKPDFAAIKALTKEPVPDNFDEKFQELLEKAFLIQNQNLS